MKKKRKISSMCFIFLLIQLFFAFFLQDVYATNEELEINADSILEEQKDNLNIKSFLNEANKYTGEFFEDVNMTDLLNSAIKGEIDNSTLFKKAIGIFGTEVRDSITLMRKYFGYCCYS